MPGAIVVGGFASYPPHPFLVLIQEKGAKENQAPTGGGEAGRVRDGAIEIVFDGGGFVSGAIVVEGFTSYPLHPFLVLIQEKGAKENQAPTGGGEAGRVLNGAFEMSPDGGRRRAGATVCRQGMGELHSPQHVPKRDRGARRSGAGKLISIGGEWVTRAGKIKSDGGE